MNAAGARQIVQSFMRIQVVSGLGIHRIQYGNFVDILRPAARDLIILGDSLKSGDPVNNKFQKYLLDNWSRIVYIEGCSERMSFNPCLKGHYQRLLYIRHGTTVPLGRSSSDTMYTLLCTPYIPWDIDRDKQGQVKFLETAIKQTHGNIVVCSSGKLPSLASREKVSYRLQGIADYNQHDPKIGPVVNSRTNPNGTRRRSFNMDYVIELK